METKEYLILSASDVRALEYDVRDKINSGWEVVGGIAVICLENQHALSLDHGYEFIYYQAIVK